MAVSLKLDIENLREVAAGLGIFGKQVDAAIIRALEGAGGDALLYEMKSGLRARTDTGATIADLKISKERGGVGIGVGKERGFIGTFLESGTQRHDIKAKNKSLRFDGKHYAYVSHPGTKRYRIAGKAIRTSRWEVESAILDEFDRIKDGASTGGGR